MLQVKGYAVVGCVRGVGLAVLLMDAGEPPGEQEGLTFSFLTKKVILAQRTSCMWRVTCLILVW